MLRSSNYGLSTAQRTAARHLASPPYSPPRASEAPPARAALAAAVRGGGRGVCPHYDHVADAPPRDPAQHSTRQGQGQGSPQRARVPRPAARHSPSLVAAATAVVGGGGGDELEGALAAAVASAARRAARITQERQQTWPPPTLEQHDERLPQVHKDCIRKDPC